MTAMLTRDEFDSLEVGDHLETVAILPALTTEPVILQTVQVSADRKEFVVTYHGMTLGRWVCAVTKEGLQWSL